MKLMSQNEYKSKKTVYIGKIPIGAGNPIVIQSMANTDTDDVPATIDQIERLHNAGCQIVRLAIPTKKQLLSFSRICQISPLPVIADIHFHADLAHAAIDAGAQGIRINPGNIRDDQKLESVVKHAAKMNVPIRIGINSGSLPQNIRAGFTDRAQGMVCLAMDTIQKFENWGLTEIKVSLKSSDIRTTVLANRMLTRVCLYPIHLGITEAGDPERGIVASAIGLGALLLDGIGDTIRVSLTGDPVSEVHTALQILDLLGLGTRPIADVFSCPTCARTHVDLLPVVVEVRDRLRAIPLRHTIRIAVMGCEVNGPGEASEADAGLAFSKAGAFLFAQGAKVARFDDSQHAIEALVAWVRMHFTSN